MKEVLKNIWANHKKKVIAFVISLLVALGVINDDVRQAIHEATAPTQVEAPAVEAPAAPAPTSPATEEK